MSRCGMYQCRKCDDYQSRYERAIHLEDDYRRQENDAEEKAEECERNRDDCYSEYQRLSYQSYNLYRGDNDSNDWQSDRLQREADDYNYKANDCNNEALRLRFEAAISKGRADNYKCEAESIKRDWDQHVLIGNTNY